MKLQKLGGYASIALVCVIIAIVGLTVSTFKELTGVNALNPSKMMAAYESSPIVFHVFYILMISIGILILLITLALKERMQSNAPQLMELAIIAASVTAAMFLTASIIDIGRNAQLTGTSDLSAYRAFLVLHECLILVKGAATGLWLLLIGSAGLGTRKLPLILCCLIIVSGLICIDIFFILPFAGPLRMLTLCVISLWLAKVFLRNSESSQV